MNHSKKSHALKVIPFSVLAIQLAATWSMAQPAAAPDAERPLKVGYAVVTPTSAEPSIMVFETFGERRGIQTVQAGVLPSAMTKQAILFVNASGRLSRNLGVAIANPGSDTAHITMTLRDHLGEDIKIKTIDVATGAQTARFVTELFDSQAQVSKDLIGTLELASDVAFAVVGLRFRGISFSTLPATSLVDGGDVPTRTGFAGVGGPGAIILPHFVTGGGWATEIVIANLKEAEVTVRVDLFDQKGDPLVATLNGNTASRFTEIRIPGYGVVTLAPRDIRGDSDF
ncbi:MAG: hypothetical protein HXY20_01115 [Acidobacteria bacterium]|nr:hypothetical protein [Acidobacteriota bacterium]